MSERTSTATTYVIDEPCTDEDRQAPWAADGPCEIVRVDHYGIPTQHLLCNTHARTVGHVVD